MANPGTQNGSETSSVKQGERIGKLEQDVAAAKGSLRFASWLFGIVGGVVLLIFVNSFSTIQTLSSDMKTIKETSAEYRRYAIDLTKENAELKNELVVLRGLFNTHEQVDAARRSKNP